jgi:hypothetical protein
LPGYRVVLGGKQWEERYSAIATPWPLDGFSEAEYEHHLSGFWRHVVWITKKILRGEVRAAARWMQVELRKHTYALLEEEARLAGRTPRPEARQAERWLTEDRLRQTANPLTPNRRFLADALLEEITLFEDISRVVGQAHGFTQGGYSQVSGWIREQLRDLPRTA